MPRVRPRLLGGYRLLVCLATCLGATARVASTVCPTVCSCKWRSGKQSVECTDKGLIAVPEGIDAETQLLDMSNNNLQLLPKETFVRAELLDLQKVYLRNCRIGQIDDRALRGLSNVVDLDVSRNLLTAVPSSIFEDVPNLRNLSLAHNPIHKIEASAFKCAGALTKLDLSHCRIAAIASNAFDGVEYLELLRLNGNRLSELKLNTVAALSGLHGIELHDNPWRCDCDLRPLKIWLAAENIPYPVEPACTGGPVHVRDKLFGYLHADDFACQPEIKTRQEARYVDSVAGYNATIVCRVESVPRASVSWYWNGRPLLNNTAFSSHQQIVIRERNVDTEKRSELTLTDAREGDSGQFHCIAENRAGKVEANFTLRVFRRLSGVALFGTGVYVSGMTLAVTVPVCAVMVVIVYLLYRVRKAACSRTSQSKHATGTEELYVTNGSLCHAAVESKSMSVEPVAEVVTGGCTGSVAYEPRTVRGRVFNKVGVARTDYTVGDNNSMYGGESSNPDLIADARYQEDMCEDGTGEYVRANNDSFYPGSLWSADQSPNIFATESNGDLRVDTDDRTPIIEDVSFDSSCCRRVPKETTTQRARKEYDLPTTSSTSTNVTGDRSNATVYGSANDAKITRVWRKGVRVLPPVTVVKLVLNSNSPDEGFQEGCGTDV